MGIQKKVIATIAFHKDGERPGYKVITYMVDNLEEAMTMLLSTAEWKYTMNVINDQKFALQVRAITFNFIDHASLTNS